MKYMGSKRKLLKKGLGDLLRQEMRKASRFVDLFSGSGVVSRFVASRFKKKVISVDLQLFSSVISAAYICRTRKIKGSIIVGTWIETAKRDYDNSRERAVVDEWFDSCGRKKLFKKDVLFARKLCAMHICDGVTWNAYGGYYLSPRQALQVDCLLRTLPSEFRMECLAALISTVSKTVAAPGHTAQPFQPTRDALPYIEEAWRRDVFCGVERDFKEIAKRHSRVCGQVVCGDAQTFVDEQLQDGDLVFIDPPYSGVQYSRFYHVLETVAKRTRVTVSGKGRYPSFAERPQSAFSNKSTSEEAVEKLLAALSKKRVVAVITFPCELCSNGLSGRKIGEKARKLFEVTEIQRRNDFSTLGGNNTIRDARQKTTELILVLRHKKHRAIKS